MDRLFGTDGIRGIANQPPMTAEMAVNVGRAVARVFAREQLVPKIIIGKDSRISGPMLENALAAGVCSMGGDLYLAGVLPTPGVAYLAAATDAVAGIVISASHNPFYDNGIKLFSGEGFKLSDEKEAAIEALVRDGALADQCREVRETGTVYDMSQSQSKYEDFLKAAVNHLDLSGMKIVLDCAQGATFKIAPRVFGDLGATLESLFVYPNGKNINQDCGSQHPEALQKKVLENQADIGLAFDGDGDRLIAVDERGKVVTGDAILAICARLMKQKGTLNQNTVVSTVMSNLGLGLALEKLGIHHIRADVGDRYVMAEMFAAGAVLGGEDSGHMIFLNHHTTGDGILTALKLVEAMRMENAPLSELARIMQTFPQLLMNVEVSRKPPIAEIPGLSAEIEKAQKALGDKGRIFVRYSGTQPLCRIMVEGPTPEETRRHCQHITDFIRERIGK